MSCRCCSHSLQPHRIQLSSFHISWDETYRECLKETWQSRCIDVCNKSLASSHKTSHGVLHYSMATLSVICENLPDVTLKISHRCTGWNTLSASTKGLLHMQKSIANELHHGTLLVSRFASNSEQCTNSCCCLQRARQFELHLGDFISSNTYRLPLLNCSLNISTLQSFTISQHNPQWHMRH